MEAMAARHSFHGDPARFPEVAALISHTYGREIRYIADVAGGQGMLSKLLRKYGYEAEVIDPRGWRMVGVAGREEEFDPDQASYYDLVVGVHPDQATRAVAMSALYTRTLLVPCCNFWDRSRRLGTIALVESLEEFYRRHRVRCRRVTLNIRGPKNIALLTEPPSGKIDPSAATLPPYERTEPESSSGTPWPARKRGGGKRAAPRSA
jgi:hypothetical protein